MHRRDRANIASLHLPQFQTGSTCKDLTFMLNKQPDLFLNLEFFILNIFMTSSLLTSHSLIIFLKELLASNRMPARFSDLQFYSKYLPHPFA